MSRDQIPYFKSLSEAQVRRIEELVGRELTLEQRWLEYGQSYGAGAAGGGNLLDRVKGAVEGRVEELQMYLCRDSDLMKIMGSPQTTALMALSFAITGKLVYAKFHDIDVVQLGVLIAHVGLHAICQGKF